MIGTNVMMLAHQGKYFANNIPTQGEVIWQVFSIAIHNNQTPQSNYYDAFSKKLNGITR